MPFVRLVDLILLLTLLPLGLGKPDGLPLEQGNTVKCETDSMPTEILLAIFFQSLACTGRGAVFYGTLTSVVRSLRTGSGRG